MNVQDLAAKYKNYTPAGTGGTAAPAPAAAPVSMSVQDLAAKYKNYQAPAPAQAPQQSFASKLFGAGKNFVQGAGKAGLSTLENIGQGEAQLASNLPGPAGQMAKTQAAEAKDTVASGELNAPAGKAGAVGNAVGTIAPYLTGIGEEAAAAKGVSIASRVASALGKDADQLIPKAAGLLSRVGIKTAAQTPIATAQTGNLKTGVEGGAGAAVGEEGIATGLKGAKSLIKTGEQKLVDSLTPSLTVGKIEKGITGAAQRGEEFSASELSSVKKSVDAVKNIASVLGKQASTIVRSGVKTAEGNAARLGKAIGDYSKKVVSPMLKENPVPFNFENLRGAFANVVPHEVLNNPEATAAFKRIGESFLNVIAKSIKGTGRALSEDDFNDIWNSRKVMDNIITDERGANAFGTQARTGIDAAAKAYRGAFKQFLSDSYRYSGQMDKINTFHANVKTLEQKFSRELSEDELAGLQKQMGIAVDAGKQKLADEWDKHMNNMSAVYDAIANVATKAKKEYNKSYSTLFAKKHPIATKVGAGAATTALTAVGAGEAIKHSPF